MRRGDGHGDAVAVGGPRTWVGGPRPEASAPGFAWIPVKGDTLLPRLRSLALLAFLPLALGCDSGDGMDDPPGDPTSGEYAAALTYTADGSQEAGLPTEGTGAFTFRTDDVLSAAGHSGRGAARLTLGTRSASLPSTGVSVAPAGSGYTVSITSGVNLNVTGAGQLSANGRTLTVASAQIRASAFVGLADGATTSLTFAFRSDF